MQADLRMSFRGPLVIRGVPNYRGASARGHVCLPACEWALALHTGVAGIGNEGSVTMAGIIETSVFTGWEKRRPEWVDVAWLAMRVHVGRQRKGWG